MKENGRLIPLDGAALLALCLLGIATLGAAIVFAYVPPNPPANCGEGCADNLDLLAQTHMASAAWVMAVIAAAGTVIGLITLVMIYLTLVQAKRSADAAKQVVDVTLDVGKRQIRAYLNAESAVVKMPGSLPFLSVTISIRNSGQSPALQIRGRVWLRVIEYLDGGDDGYDSSTALELHAPLIPADISAGDTTEYFLSYIALNVKPSLLQTLQDGTNLAFELHIEGSYKDVFGDEIPMDYRLVGIYQSLEKLAEGLAMKPIPSLR